MISLRRLAVSSFERSKKIAWQQTIHSNRTSCLVAPRIRRLDYRNVREFSTSASSGTSKGAVAATTTSLVAPKQKTVSRDVQWRVFQTLFNHVWPSPLTGVEDGAALDRGKIRKRKQRVVGSLGLMLAGKVVSIQVPFVFKHLVDSLPASTAIAESATTALSDPNAATTLLESSAVTSGVPIALLLGYGISRAASSGFQEWRNAVFAYVAQDAIRSVGRSVFEHIHRLDLQFHLSRNTGQISRVLDRGQRSISFTLNAMVFHIGPTLLEVSLVTGLMANQFGAAHSGVVLATVTGYTVFTFGKKQWRRHGFWVYRY